FNRVKSALKSEGVFLQWLTLNQFDRESLPVIFNTFAKAFPKNAFFMDGYRLAMVGFNTNSDPRFSDIALRIHARATLDSLSGESVEAWVVKYWGKIISDTEGLIQDEWFPVIEYSLPKKRYSGESNVDSLLRFLLESRLDIRAEELPIPVASLFGTRLGKAYASNRLFYEAYLKRTSDDMAKYAQLAHLSNPTDFWAGRQLADLMFSSVQQGLPSGVSRLEALRGILAVRPDHLQTLALYQAVFEQSGDLADADSVARYMKILREH
ncbi:MAG: hypothetical protein OEX07_05260, partial [Gammaproteobacteria bacterium]|nr:hypothetical protein [Gammaproteobacteria bacterium]